MKKLLFVIPIVLFSAACATQSGTAKKVNSAWTGRHIDEFVLKNGAPYTSFKFSNGDTAYRWNSGTKNLDLTYNVGAFNVGNTAMVCEIQILSDSRGVIKQVTGINDTKGIWKGSRCAEALKS